MQKSLFSDESSEEREPFTVAGLTTYIRLQLERDTLLQDLWVEGEISNLTRAPSGHLYFTLKDADAQLRAVMWKSSTASIRLQPQHGDHILAHGRITVYDARGEYQLVIDTIQPVGLGDLHHQFELLKTKLEADGLFDPIRKRSLPFFPHKIGVVTSPTAAAFQDVLNVLRRRFPVAEVILSPTLVQGNEAPPQIVAALERLYQHTGIDVILLIRGGGSLEDLWCFNDERVVRKVATSPVPLVTGVGHEIDFTLVDFAADFRAPTPTAAAVAATPESEVLRYNVQLLWRRASTAMAEVTDVRRQGLTTQKRALRHLSPRSTITNFRQRVDDLAIRLQNGVTTQLKTKHQNLDARATALHAASPLTILARGYAIVRRAGDGKQLTNAIDADTGTLLDIQLQYGQLQATVKKRELGDNQG